ncbi:DUF805 domain-containing protein [uncultured Jannaschia sp.]|uniref:DUF805 domain-containing protein n=1 Tax=uncultured Jannaschia sp. TaxID=293347 RepID=UPI0026170D57|nr:DUF805 domain-containing protein [uncultured Jannaschia sp.]
MTFSESVRTVLQQKYATFSGRASRSEFWWFALFSFIGGVVASLIDGVIFGSDNGGIVNGLFTLAIIVPSLAVGARRLHDTDRTGWWLLIWLVPLIGWIVLIVFWVLRGTDGENRFGPPPHVAPRLDHASAGPISSSSIPRVDR